MSRILIVSHDLKPSNYHLMPWRTLLEVAKYSVRANNDTLILSLQNKNYERWSAENVDILPFQKPRSKSSLADLKRSIERFNPDVIFWPISWWRMGRSKKLLKSIHASKIAYVPGSFYFVKSTLLALPHLGIKSTSAYLRQAIYPNYLLTQELTTAGFSKTIAITELTKSKLTANKSKIDSNRVVVIPPGRPCHLYTSINTQHSKLKSILPTTEPYFLFFGPPTAIRGVRQLLEAFKLVASKHQTINLICLFREDSNIDLKKIMLTFAGKSKHARCHYIWKSLDKETLNYFISKCYAVVLPFLIVPSEIPLAIIESLGHGKKVITTGPSGTGDFVNSFGKTAKASNSKDLAEKMLELIEENGNFNGTNEDLIKMYQAHPTWEEVGKRWLTVSQFES